MLSKLTPIRSLLVSCITNEIEKGHEENGSDEQSAHGSLSSVRVPLSDSAQLTSRYTAQGKNCKFSMKA